MIEHLSFYAIDFAKTRAFYEAALPPLGYEKVVDAVATWNEAWPTQRMAAFGPPGKPAFWIIETRERPTPRHLAFYAKTRAAVDAFHQAAVATGARDNGAPGLRAVYHPTYYGAFVIDPDGNNVEAVCHKPE